MCNTQVRRYVPKVLEERLHKGVIEVRITQADHCLLSTGKESTSYCARHYTVWVPESVLLAAKQLNSVERRKGE